jgi:hypothetical protein
MAFRVKKMSVKRRFGLAAGRNSKLLCKITRPDWRIGVAEHAFAGTVLRL